MTRPRLSVRTLILVVAALAILLAIFAAESKRQRFRHLTELIASYAKREAYWIVQEKAMRQYEAQELAAGRPSSAAIHASQALYDHDHARYYGSLRLKYETALLRPDLATQPDPVAPHLYPRDYLSRVPYYVPDRGADKGPMP